MAAEAGLKLLIFHCHCAISDQLTFWMRWKGLITQVQLNYSKSKLYLLKKSWSLSPESALHLKTFGIFRSCGSIGGRRNHHSEILGTVDCISNIRIVHSCWSIRPTRKTMEAEKWLCMLTSMNISKSSLIPRIVPKCLVINAHLLMKPDAVSALYAELLKGLILVLFLNLAAQECSYNCVVRFPVTLMKKSLRCSAFIKSSVISLLLL